MDCIKSTKGVTLTLMHVFLLVTFIAGVSAETWIRCLSCRKVLHLSACNNVELCDADHKACYIEKDQEYGGEVVISAGCREKTDCSSLGCFGGVGTTHRRRRDTRTVSFQGRNVVCHHCCDGDLCNANGCTDSQQSTVTINRCFHCDLAIHPRDCHQVVTCHAHEICYVQLNIAADNKRYTTGCMKKPMCDKLDEIRQMMNGRRKRNYVPVMAECCKDDLCNGDIPMASHPISMTSPTYVCPAHVDSTTTVKSTTASHTQRPCVDQVHCNGYDFNQICSGSSEFLPWAVHNCPKFCGFCTEAATTTTTLATTTEPCVDHVDNCAVYGFSYICQGTYEPWAKLNCKKFCQFCTDGTTTTTLATTTTPKTTTAQPTMAGIECKDAISNCAIYGRHYICYGEYVPWSKLNCPAFCGFCSSSQDSTTPTTTTTTTTPTTSVGVTSGCRDVMDNCDIYGRDYICTYEFEPWAKQNCAAFCGHCHNQGFH